MNLVTKQNAKGQWVVIPFKQDRGYWVYGKAVAGPYKTRREARQAKRDLETPKPVDEWAAMQAVLDAATTQALREHGRLIERLDLTVDLQGEPRALEPATDGDGSMIWYVKRRPTHMSFLRDGFPYLEMNMPAGSMWVQTRGEAARFTSLKTARQALKLVRRFDPDTMIVRTRGTL